MVLAFGLLNFAACKADMQFTKWRACEKISGPAEDGHAYIDVTSRGCETGRRYVKRAKYWLERLEQNPSGTDKWLTTTEIRIAAMLFRRRVVILNLDGQDAGLLQVQIPSGLDGEHSIFDTVDESQVLQSWGGGFQLMTPPDKWKYDAHDLHLVYQSNIHYDALLPYHFDVHKDLEPWNFVNVHCAKYARRQMKQFIQDTRMTEFSPRPLLSYCTWPLLNCCSMEVLVTAMRMMDSTLLAFGRDGNIPKNGYVHFEGVIPPLLVRYVLLLLLCTFPPIPFTHLSMFSTDTWIGSLTKHWLSPTVVLDAQDITSTT